MSLAHEPGGSVDRLHDRWIDVVAGLPRGTAWAVDAELVGTTDGGRDVETRGILSHDTTRLRFTDWRGSVLMDVALRTLHASVVKGDLRCADGDRLYVLDDFCHLGVRLGTKAPSFAVEPGDSPFLPVLSAVHAAR